MQMMHMNMREYKRKIRIIVLLVLKAKGVVQHIGEPCPVTIHLKKNWFDKKIDIIFCIFIKGDPDTNIFTQTQTRKSLLSFPRTPSLQSELNSDHFDGDMAQTVIWLFERYN